MLPQSIKMKRWFILLIFLILGANAALAESTIITIGVNESGNASWTMEKQIPLTPSELNEWEAAIKSGQNLSKYRDITQFNDTINTFISSAQNFTNRSMKIENVNVTYNTSETVSGDFGIVLYNFLWINFSRTDSDKILIGDAFPDGLALSSDSVLVVEIPDGYNVTNATPNFYRQEGNRLIWDMSMYHSFGKGEPSIILQRTSNISTMPTIPTISGASGISPVILVPLVILIAAGVVIFWKKRQSGGSESAQMDAMENDIEPPIPFPYPEDDLGEEDLIEQFLIKSGGQAYQSDIVKERGLSKSKISIVLARMKEEGKIIKIKKGKENLIRLARKE